MECSEGIIQGLTAYLEREMLQNAALISFMVFQQWFLTKENEKEIEEIKQLLTNKGNQK